MIPDITFAKPSLVEVNSATGEVVEPQLPALSTRTDSIPVLTPEQARIETVHRVIGSAMDKASLLMLTPEESKSLQETFPDEAFKPGAAGKDELIYIEHASLRDRFNSVLGLGQWALILTRPYWAELYQVWDKESGGKKSATRIYAQCALLVRGSYVAEAIGDSSYFPDNARMNYGDAAEGAKSQAFRRCAKEFGVGLQAWHKDWCDGWWLRNGERFPKAWASHKTSISKRIDVPAGGVQKNPPIQYAPDPDAEDTLANGIRAASNLLALGTAWQRVNAAKKAGAITAQGVDRLTLLKEVRKALIRQSEPGEDREPGEDPPNEGADALDKTLYKPTLSDVPYYAGILAAATSPTQVENIRSCCNPNFARWRALSDSGLAEVNRLIDARLAEVAEIDNNQASFAAPNNNIQEA